jgi:uncharacterized damage-inducible protein DinB
MTDAARQNVAPTQRIVMLQTLGNAASRLAGELEALGADGADWHPAPDEWSARETVTHLAAAEPHFLQRLQRIAAEDNPFLPYFGPDVARPDAGLLLPAALEQFRAGRERLLAFLAGLPPEAWDRLAVHETMGLTNLALQVQNIINHDLEHLAQLHQDGQLRARNGRVSI